jgi:hypothetical protein
MDDVLALSTAEQFALWSLRRRRACPWDAATLAEGFFRAFGVSGVEEALASFAALCESLSRHGRRRLSLNGCNCRALAADERSLLGLLAAAQAGERRHAEAIALWLCRPAGQAELLAAADCFAAAFQRRGLLLPAPSSPRLTRRRAPASASSSRRTPSGGG